MTKKQRYLHKLANAIRDRHGGKYRGSPRKDVAAKDRVNRWFFRCSKAGYIKGPISV